MPGKIKVKVLAGRNLPVMDRASDTTDAFVEVKFGGVTHKTDVCRKSLNPQWNSTEWYRFEVDESELQDEPLQLRLMDHDTYSANDAIGKVVISLAPLLAREANNTNGIAGPPGGAVMSGWIPVFDTMHGIRGELNVIVKVELFSDFNKYKTSSCGVQFFHCPMIPPGYRVSAIHGFVEELIVNDDPEYQWIDKIRTPRASNEARQVAFIKLSNQVQRLVGLKAAELGANAVVGYQQDFDLEGEAGVVARAIGTAVSITPLPLPSQPMSVQLTQQASLSGPSSIYSKDEHHFREQRSFKKEKPAIKPAGLVHTAMETILIDKVQSLLIPTSPDFQSAEKKFFDDVNERLESVEAENKAKDTANNNAKYKKERKLIRQDSIHSKAESIGSLKMSKENTSNVATPCKLTHTPVLQNFHPILSGAHLETIPSLPESGVDRSESLDVEGVESECDTNSASVCGNSHAACDLDRDKCEREKGDREKCERDKDRGSPRHARHESYGGREPAPPPAPSLHSTSTPLGIHRRSSDSDLSITPKGGSLNASLGNTGSGGGAILRPSMNSNNLDMLEYPFLTMTEYPPGFIVHIGGTVCARSVKLVDGGGGGESGSRAAWWAELRTELRAHARALRCPAVLAYCERAAVREDVCVLSASGTAAVINLDCDFNTDEPYVSLVNGSKNTIEESENESCSIAHVPYSPGSGPYRAELATCGECRRARVPTVLLATCSKPNRLTSYGKAVTLTAVAGRIRRAPPAAEPGARDISDQLPFLEYELHKLLLAKLRMQGANAIFSLQTQIAIGERCVMALAAGTAVRLAALPPPAPPRIKATENDKDALEIQKALWDAFTANKAANGYDIGTVCEPTRTNDIEGEEPPALDLCADKDACLLELDEAEDVETAKLLASRRNNMQVYTNALKPSTSPHAQPYAFMQVWRTRLGAVGPSAERLVASALSGAAYKLRRLQPAALAPPAFQLDLPEDEIQLVVSGTALPLQDPTKVEHTNGTEKELQHEDDIFALDEDQLVKSQTESNDERATGPVGRVSLSTLAQVSGSRCARRVCALRLLFVRETTGVRELGGLSGFLHTFTCEVLAIVRAYTAALGGNALTSFYVTHLMLQDNAHKNQGQCLLSVGGDVVHITY
ncbi:C2 domain-containing protein 5 isoform X4 [Zerene cesonia]|uniref:C2 domain-containing protein 5 isoform X4 n=1 Tax=Zerene cesonia TaxID=33412 RepID=UPI0018E56946|nr:C2 domain-containing protein 5 isoform X4 [Zerene cesonia]